MRRSLLSASVAAALTLGHMAPLHASPQRIGDFALLDQHGRFHQLTRYQHVKGLVVMAYDADCPSMPQAVEAFEDLAARFRPQGIEFLLLETEGAAGSAPWPILADSSQLVAESLGFEQTGEVRVINPQRLTLVYRGAPDAAEASLKTLLAGTGSRADTVIGPAPQSCALNYPVRDQHRVAPPDYAADIAPLIIEECSECHRTGGVGPFALDSYTALLGWSPMIREVLLNRRMPPTQIDTSVAHSPSARSLSDTQLQTLVHWFDAGAPRGADHTDPLAAFSDKLQAAADTASGASPWLGGEPDLVLTAPRHEIPVSGLLDYVYADLVVPSSEDRWLRAVQYVPESVSTLHHLMGFVTAPAEDFWGAEREQSAVERRFLGAFSPGAPRLIEFPEGTGVRIPAGHKLSLQFHYIPNGLPGKDETRIGLYFHSTPPARELLTAAISTRDFVIPPEVPEFPVQTSHLFSEDIVITAVRPRMGYRGKFMRFSLQSPDNAISDFFSVPAYNYGWQPDYLLEQPLRVPAGSQLILSGAFDNSISNPANPDPGQQIRAGFERGEEAFTGYVTFYRQ